MQFRIVESYRQSNIVNYQNIYHLVAVPESSELEDIRSLGKRIDELIKEKFSGKKFICRASNN
jgi:hypothetical protein